MARLKAPVLVGLNLLGLPGLGSFLAGRRITGVLQMLLSIIGFVCAVIWFIGLITLYARSDDFPDLATLPFRLLIAGGILFAIAWLWTLVTSLQILRDARTTKP